MPESEHIFLPDELCLQYSPCQEVEISSTLSLTPETWGHSLHPVQPHSLQSVPSKTSAVHPFLPILPTALTMAIISCLYAEAVS
jgi:hypothetical protein